MRTYAQLEVYLRAPERTLAELCEEHEKYYGDTDYSIREVKRAQDLLHPSRSECVELRLDGGSDQSFKDLESARAYIVQETLDHAINCFD